MKKKEVNLRSLYFTYFPNYVCNLQYDTNKKLYKSAISHPIGLFGRSKTQNYLNLTVAIKTIYENQNWLKRIYNPMTAMGFLAMFTFQLDNIKR